MQITGPWVRSQIWIEATSIVPRPVDSCLSCLVVTVMPLSGTGQPGQRPMAEVGEQTILLVRPLLEFDQNSSGLPAIRH